MTKSEAIEYFGSQKAMCEALQRAKSTVSNYPETLPRGIQFEIQVKTGGQLQADSCFFEPGSKAA
ncbi:hypothetical protein AMBLS11_12480 [Alteromonas macleodii str. 'Black Sea 11']|nr:hypothetical protein AMBLS11_12480 [Alteromonas macleodii str. 'Black Sea 11']